jgi:hypothetical protein
MITQITATTYPLWVTNGLEALSPACPPTINGPHSDIGSANGQGESHARRDIRYHGIDARRMQRAGYGRESTDGPEPRMWRRCCRLECLVAARSMCRRPSCPGLDDHLARAVDGPSTGSAATRSASEYRLSPARRCEKEAGRTREQRPRGGWGAERVRVRSTAAQTPRASCVCSRPIAHRFGEGFTSSSPTVQQCLFRVQKRTSAPCCRKVRYVP